ncbi:ARF/SAR superfamily [Ceratobasidium sp. AG-I]|nr:ARF/SAR superfamily [Ceratobasidium sp. AG-I]
MFITTAFAIWNVGEDQYRPYWEHLFPKTTGIVFVVDSNDRQRVPKAREEIHYLLNRLSGIPLLVINNKNGGPGGMNAAETTDKLELHGIKERPWYIQNTVATTGEGLDEGFHWVF